MEFEIKSIVRARIKDIKQSIKELGNVSEMSDKRLKLYYIYSGQVCVLEKVNREIGKYFRELKKETASRSNKTVSNNLYVRA